MRFRNAVLLVLGFLTVAGCSRQQPVNRAAVEESAGEPGSKPLALGSAAAITEVRKLGGDIQTDETDPRKPGVRINLRNSQDPDTALAHVAAVPNVMSLDLAFTVVTNDGLQHLKGCNRLREVSLAGTQVSDQGLEHLAELTGLQKLDIGETDVSQSGLAHLRGLTTVEELILKRIPTGDMGLAHLAGLTNLRTLDLHGTSITGAGLAHLRGLKKLRVLRIDSNPGINDAGLAYLSGMANLERLYLESTGVSDAGLVHLKGLTNLRELDLYNTNVTAAGVDKLRESLPAIEVR
jgi:hypothetical protein